MWREELSSLLETLFKNGADQMPVQLRRKTSAGNEEIAHWILVISCFLKSQYSEQEKCSFVRTCAGYEMDRLGTPPLLWMEELRNYLMVSLKS